MSNLYQATCDKKGYSLAETAFPFDESVGQEGLVDWTIGLDARALLDEAVLP